MEIYFTNILDPEPRARRVFAFHAPQTLAGWAKEAPQTLRGRLRTMPPLANDRLWGPQVRAIHNLEFSLAQDKPRALIQMATGSGKTYTAVNFIYRLISQAGARRVLFLVDRNNLGKQANNEFVNFETPDDGRKFSELYNIRHLNNNVIDIPRDVHRVYISTIQRLYALLKDEELEEEEEALSLYEAEEKGRVPSTPRTVSFTGKLPVEFFDFIVIDECHRSIYTVWRQVLEYFDAHLIGLTATPSKQTIGFFNQNLVMEYTHDHAVADGINVAGEVYKILTRISDEGSSVEAGHWVGKMDKVTRARWQEMLDEDLVYSPRELDRDVVSESQMRTIIRHFRDVLFTELFPGRAGDVVPKTLIFAKDDNHAENIVRLVREEFAKGNDFCQKITYRAQRNPEEILQDFRNSYHPRVAVTVDMIATGTDVRAIEILLFMRQVRSRGYFEQMRGRGTRVIGSTELEGVTRDAGSKTHFILIDAVGLTEAEMIDPPVVQERKRAVSFDRLLESIAFGAHDQETVASLAHRLARLQQTMTAEDKKQFAEASGFQTLPELIHPMIAALESEDPAQLLEATTPLRGNPRLRSALLAIHRRAEIIIDTESLDTIKESGFDSDATLSLRQSVDDFQKFIEENKDELGALQLLYNRPYGAQYLTRRQLQELAEALQAPPHFWTEEKLWSAYAQLDKDRVRGAGSRRVLTDLISLVRHALQPEASWRPIPSWSRRVMRRGWPRRKRRASSLARSSSGGWRASPRPSA